MAVEKMRLLSVVGKEEKINSFILKYLIGSGLQPENAIKIFEKGWNLSYFAYDNTARELQKECQELEKKLETQIKSTGEDKLTHSLEEIQIKVKNIKEGTKESIDSIEEKQTMLNTIENQIQMLKYLKNLDINLEELYTLRYMRFRYGKILKENLDKIKAEMDDIDAILLELRRRRGLGLDFIFNNR